MQGQDIYKGQVERLFTSYNPHPSIYKSLATFLHQQCRGSVQATGQFLKTLSIHPKIQINFNSFCKIIRIIRKITIPHKHIQMQFVLTNFIIDSGQMYFPYSNTFNSRQFKQYLNLFANLAVQEPENYNDHRRIIVYLTKENYTAQWANGLIQKINGQVLVDRKNQQAKFLKVNHHLSSFLVKHFQKIIPQLDRLLVRSESNIEIWEEFAVSVNNWKNIDSFVVQLLSKIKNLFQNNPEISIRLVNSITKNLKQEKHLRDIIGFLSALISGEHNAKKKITFIKMLEGVLQSLKNHDDLKLRNELSQDILLLLINSLTKFTEEDQFNILTDILDELLPLISEPKEDVAKAGKIYLKNQNKYIQILFATIISNIYRKEHIEQFASVKEIFTHYKTQLNALLKANWQVILPVLHFLSQFDIQFLDNLNSELPLFKVSCLALTKLQKKTSLKLIIKYLQFLKVEENGEIPNNIYVISSLLLQQIKERTVWEQFINKLEPEQKIRLVSRGIFPLSLFSCQQIKKNKGNSFNSLLLFIWHSFGKGNVQISTGSDFLKIVMMYFKLKPQFQARLQTQNKKQVEQIIQKYVRGSLFQQQVDQQKPLLSDQDIKHIQYLSNAALSYRQQLLIHLVQQFTQEDYYKKNLQFLLDFQEEVLNHATNIKNQLQQIKEELVERSIHKPVEIKKKKLYVGIKFEVKMMSQLEVKEQKYRLHFLKMLSIFNKIIAELLNTINSHQFVNELWHHNLKSLLSVTKFPQHRLSIQKLIKRSLIFTSWHNRSSPQAKIFSKHAEFLGQFFALRYSGITPSVKLMSHCEHFLKQLLSIPFEQQNTKFSLIQSNQKQFVMLLVNQMCQYLLENMEFDVNLKKNSIRFYYKCNCQKISFNNQQLLFTFIVNNINILASSEFIQPVLLSLLKKVDQKRYKQLFTDILNFILQTKKLILHTITLLQNKYKPEFEQFIKLKILALESNQEIVNLAENILSTQGQLKKSILTFNMKNFVEKNSKQTIQKLCLFIKEQITPQNCQDIFKMVILASEQLFDQGFDQQGLQMFPFFLTINIEHIGENLYKPIFQLLITKFTSKQNFGTLTKLSNQIGINIIKRNAKDHAQKLLLVLEGFINKATGVSNIIYLGVLAPYLEGNKNLQIIERRITELFQSNKENEQKAISKCMPDLMSFFKKPLEIIENIFINISTFATEGLQIGQAYLFSGLLKGTGYKETQQYLDRILSPNYITKTKLQKTGRIHLLGALVQNFGRVVQLKGIRIISIMIGYMADNVEQIRNIAKRVGQSLIVKMSSYSVKILLPELLKGLEQEQNWRIKISYIWILGIMANSSARQLQTSLPVIVPTLSTCLSNAHPTIRQKASQALNLIGQTIKNPEISTCVDILIQALENPFENSERAIQILLRSTFNHYIDPPSLSMIIPILDYCMRGRSSDLKAGACQVIGSIVELISNSYDLLPYLKIIITGLKTALCDPLPQIRCIAAMAMGKISSKIGIKQAEGYFKFVVQIIESPLSNTTERQGAAQAYAQIICSHTYEYFEQTLYKIFQKLNAIKHSQKEGYILVFLYVPSIRTQQFQGFIKQVNQNMYIFVSDEQENIRNSAMMVQKVLINNYCLSHTDLLLGPLCDGVFENNWKKRNAALILIGQLLNIIKSHMYNTRSNDKSYAYYRGLMAVYIIKDDELEMPRLTANQVWNTYIQNTPKTIRTGLSQLVKMWTRWTHAADGVVFKNIVAFSGKYGQNYFTEILQYIQQYLREPQHQVGCFQVLAQFIKRLNNQYLSKESFKITIRSIFTDNLYTIPEHVRPSLAKCFALYIDKMHEQSFFEQLIYSSIEKMDKTDENNKEYTSNLHLLKDLLNTNSVKVVDRVINKIMEPPMSEFKIQVITNNASKLANYLYTHFKIPATEILVEEIYTLVQNKSKENRLSLIIYCLEQVSLQLTHKNKEQFVKMINLNIYKQINQFNDGGSHKKILEIFINMLIFFLNSTPLSELEDLQTIIGQLCPLIFFNDQNLKTLGHKIFLLLISDNKSQNTSFYIRQMVVSLQNMITKSDQLIWEDEVVFKDYVSMLVKGIAYGKQETMEQSLEMLEFMMKHTPRKIIEKQILRIVGPIIRISNYPLFQKQKVRIMEVLINILKQSYKIDAYNNQILSVTLRLLQEFKNSEQVMRVVADIYLSLLIGTSLKQDLIFTILSKLRTFGSNLVHSFYYLIKSIIAQKVQLPKNVYQKIFEECMIILLTNEGKLPVKGLYYASKIAARLGVFMERPIQRVQIAMSGVTCSYQNVIHYLHFAYYKKIKLPKVDAIEIFLKESNRQKVHYLLKSLKLCLKNSEQAKKKYSQQYIRSLVPQTLIGFDDISELLECFESERVQEEIISAEINIP